jgi:predicted RNase H-like nuclease
VATQLTAQEITDTTIPDLIIPILPPAALVTWLQRIIELKRERGETVDGQILRWLERIEALKPVARNIGPGLDAAEFYALEKLLFVATSGDAGKVNRARKDLEACRRLAIN